MEDVELNTDEVDVVIGDIELKVEDVEVVEVADDCDISIVTVGPLTSTIEYSVAVTVFAAGVTVTRNVWVLSEAEIVFVDTSL